MKKGKIIKDLSFIDDQSGCAAHQYEHFNEKWCCTWNEAHVDFEKRWIRNVKLPFVFIIGKIGFHAIGAVICENLCRSLNKWFGTEWWNLLMYFVCYFFGINECDSKPNDWNVIDKSKFSKSNYTVRRMHHQSCLVSDDRVGLHDFNKIKARENTESTRSSPSHFITKMSGLSSSFFPTSTDVDRNHTRIVLLSRSSRIIIWTSWNKSGEETTI